MVGCNAVLVFPCLRDACSGVDNEEAYAVPNLVFHQFEPKEYMAFSASLFSVGIVIGLVLTILTGWQLLVIGAIGFVLAASYSFFKFRAMGDIFVFCCFGVLPVIGSSFVETGVIEWSALALSLPLGIFTVAVLWFWMFSPWTSGIINFWVSMSCSAVILPSLSGLFTPTVKHGPTHCVTAAYRGTMI